MSRNTVLLAGSIARCVYLFDTRYRFDRTARIVAVIVTRPHGYGGQTLPGELCGPLYPDGVPIVAADELAALVASQPGHTICACADDPSVAAVTAIAQQAGWDFRLCPTTETLQSVRPVVAVGGVRPDDRTGVAAAIVVAELVALGQRVAVLRHPAGLSPLEPPLRFDRDHVAATAELSRPDRAAVRLQVEAGAVVWFGINCADMLARAEDEADVIVWDGGGDTPFVHPDRWIATTTARNDALPVDRPNLANAEFVLLGVQHGRGQAAVRAAQQAIRDAVPFAPVVTIAVPPRAGALPQLDARARAALRDSLAAVARTSSRVAQLVAS